MSFADRLYDPRWCRYCDADHPTRAHHDPADARREAERARENGDETMAGLWLRVAMKLERRSA